MGTPLPSIFDRFKGKPLDMGAVEQAMADDIERRTLRCLRRANKGRLAAFGPDEHLPGLGEPAPRNPPPEGTVSDFSWEDD